MSLPIIHATPLTSAQLQALAYVKRNGPAPRFVWARAGIDSRTMGNLVQRGLVQYLSDIRAYDVTEAGRSA